MITAPGKEINLSSMFCHFMKFGREELCYTPHFKKDIKNFLDIKTETLKRNILSKTIFSFFPSEIDRDHLLAFLFNFP